MQMCSQYWLRLDDLCCKDRISLLMMLLPLCMQQKAAVRLVAYVEARSAGFLFRPLVFPTPPPTAAAAGGGGASSSSGNNVPLTSTDVITSLSIVTALLAAAMLIMLVLQV